MRPMSALTVLEKHVGSGRQGERYEGGAPAAAAGRGVLKHDTRMALSSGVETTCNNELN